MTLKKGAKGFFKIPVTNIASYYIILKKNRVVSCLEYVASVSSFNIKLSPERQKAKKTQCNAQDFQIKLKLNWRMMSMFRPVIVL